VYYVFDYFGRTYHGFIIYKLKGVNEPQFLVLSSFAGNYRLMDWMNNFENVIAERKDRYTGLEGFNAPGDEGLKIHGTDLKKLAAITTWLTRYQQLLGSLKKGDVLENDGIQQKAYMNLWGSPNFLKTPVQDTAHSSVFQSDTDLDPVKFAERVERLKTMACKDGDAEVNPCPAADPIDMPKFLD